MKSHFTPILLLVFSIADAQEINSSYLFHGFSDDLKYAILETYYDAPVESQPAVTKFIVVDVEKNSYAVSPLTYAGKAGMSLDATRKNGRKAADKLFVQFGVNGKRLGTKIPLEKADNRLVDPQTFIINGSNHILKLKAIPTGEKIIEMYDKVMMDLSIAHDGKTQILQKDRTLPKSRGNVMGYELKAVFYDDDRLAIVVEYQVGPGFEGSPDRYDMLVTGVLK